jgi:hypothetical protein
MKKLLLKLVVAVALLPAVSLAADDKDQDVVQDLGAVLGWRLGPQLVEERCRSVDPEGADARKKLLQTWLDKNGGQIKAVDDRVAEIAPLLDPNANGADMVQAVRRQVAALLQDSIFAGKKGDDLKDFCRKETDAKNPRWSNTGMPDVQESLAAMYDWKIRQEKK